MLEREPLYQFASRQQDAVTLMGRAPVFAVNLPGNCGRVVVRHNMRGGWMARISRDLFVLPTRGFRELIASLRLRASGVSTPEVIAYVSYPLNVFLRRSDVATREIPNGHDLSVALAEVTDHDHRRMVLDAVVKLLNALTHAGAYHQDLNLKNILLTAGSGPGLDAHVLDVDRVQFSSPGSPLVARANVDRLIRSLRKWRDLRALPYSAADEEYLRSRSTE
ncbi:MAG TPA: lipopolysaccharide kinase InaA family protein [Gemmatimonadaceae bacterium]|nr:lipopolysaccharide kinase InaA family protein [Gemmatimonadaceae bacterium]